MRNLILAVLSVAAVCFHFSSAHAQTDCRGLPDEFATLAGDSCLQLEASFGSPEPQPVDIEEELRLEAFSAAICDAASSCNKQVQPKKLPTVDVTILFELNSDRIQASEYRNILRLAETLAHPALAQKRFILVGHTDITGSLAHNNDLSARRAASVRNALAGQGLSVGLIETAGVGPQWLLPHLPMDHPDQRRVTIAAFD